MKPVYIGLLMMAAAFGGGLLVTLARHSAEPALSAEASAEPATPAPVAAPAAWSAPAPVKAPAPVYEAAVQPVPSITMEVKAAPEIKRSPAPLRPPVTRRREPAPAPKSELAAAYAQAQAHPEPAVTPPSPPATPPVEAAPEQVAPPVAPAPEPAPTVALKPEPEAPIAPAPPVNTVTLAPGTLISVRTVEALSSDGNASGDGFSATLDRPLIVDGFAIAERGARAEGRVVAAQRGARARGGSELGIELTRLTTSDGQHIAIETDTFLKHGQSSAGMDAAKIGGGAAAGAIIGAIAGQGMGAAVGAAAGGAIGAGDVLLTRGRPATLSSETHINFRLRTAVTITERTGN